MTTIDNLAAEISKQLEEYSQEVTDAIKKVVDVVAKEVNEEIKNHINFKEVTGDYVKAFRIKTTQNTRFNKINVWHVTNGQYRLTHLLEKGHALRNGGRSSAFPHIIFGQELAEKRMVELSKEAISNIKS